jgi:thiol-disulfide isomerase/thioredoxin
MTEKAEPVVVPWWIIELKKEILESTKLVMVNFWDPECPNCEMMEPVFIELAEEYEGLRQGWRPTFQHGGGRQADSEGVTMTENADYRTGLKPVWCAGCGIGIVMSALIRAIDRIGLQNDQVALVSGIGCTARMPVADATTHGLAELTHC